jgi:hypothetical protein
MRLRRRANTPQWCRHLKFPSSRRGTTGSSQGSGRRMTCSQFLCHFSSYKNRLPELCVHRVRCPFISTASSRNPQHPARSALGYVQRLLYPPHRLAALRRAVQFPELPLHVIRAQIRHKPFQLPILALRLPQPPCLLDAHAAEALAPRIIGLTADREFPTCLLLIIG